jgi:hypothetical protein
MARTIFAALLIAVVAAENAQAASEYASNPYLNYSCRQLRRAAEQAAARAEQETGVKNDTGSTSAPADEAGPRIIWPKAFFANVSGDKAVELSQLKQELISIEKASIQGQCDLQFDGPRPPGA